MASASTEMPREHLGTNFGPTSLRSYQQRLEDERNELIVTLREIEVGLREGAHPMAMADKAFCAIESVLHGAPTKGGE